MHYAGTFKGIKSHY